MIGSLTGKITSIRNPIIIDVNGVGYLVHLPEQLLNKLKPNGTITFKIHTHIREDSFELFGFESDADLQLFELLLSVSGIGPRTALNIISRGSNFVHKAVIDSDVDFFTTIPRLGRKNAQKIIIELKSKLGSLTDLDLDSSSQYSETTEALTSMGFNRHEILNVLKKMPTNLTISEQLRFCLKHLSRHN